MNWFWIVWPYLLALATLIIDLGFSCHVILHKRDTRAAIAWVGFIWFVPLAGSFLYLMFGINRIERKARKLRADPKWEFTPMADQGYRVPSNSLKHLGDQFSAIATSISKVSSLPLVSGNEILPLDRRTCYPAMYAAIEKAVKTITLSSYIFDNDLTGNKFVNALAAAKQKGVQIRVLVDDVGARYSWPRIFRALENVGIVHARFYPRRTPWTILYANLRNHRKLLVVDGKVGFTGGMNIRNRHSPDAVKDHAVEDMHFRLTGPIVLQLQNVFADDWQFATGEVLTDEMWFPEWKGTGSMICRAIVDGPDEHLNNVQLALAAAISCAKETVTIVTPYFIPDRELIAVLSLASMRGVTVDIVMPQKNNLFFVEWASMALRWQMLEKGCRMWLTKPPFDHSKLILIDGCWSMFGSSNWDARSLRLNFELNVECYDKALCQTMKQMAAEKISNSRPLTLEDVNNRPLLIKLRDGIARLFSPYL